MKTILLRSCAILLACTGATANAAGILEYNYSFEWSKAISTNEASSVTYNWDQNRLMVTNDEESGSNAKFGEYDMNGNFLATITVAGCNGIAGGKCDPEGLTYIGNNTYTVAAERSMDIYKLTSGTTDGNRNYTSLATAPQISVNGAADDVGNKGLEGITFDKATGDYWGVKETGEVYKIAGANWNSETATVTNVFTLSSSGFDALNDITVLSNGNLLILTSGDAANGSEMTIREYTQSGGLLGSFALQRFRFAHRPPQQEQPFRGPYPRRGRQYLSRQRRWRQQRRPAVLYVQAEVQCPRRSGAHHLGTHVGWLRPRRRRHAPPAAPEGGHPLRLIQGNVKPTGRGGTQVSPLLHSTACTRASGCIGCVTRLTSTSSSASSRRGVPALRRDHPIAEREPIQPALPFKNAAAFCAVAPRGSIRPITRNPRASSPASSIVPMRCSAPCCQSSGTSRPASRVRLAAKAPGEMTSPPLSSRSKIAA